MSCPCSFGVVWCGALCLGSVFRMESAAQGWALLDQARAPYLDSAKSDAEVGAIEIHIPSGYWLPPP